MPIDKYLENLNVDISGKQNSIQKATNPQLKQEYRSDIDHLLRLSDSEFNQWYDERFKAAEELIKRYSLFASIPNLTYGTGKHLYGYDMRSISVINMHLDALNKGLEFLIKIKMLRDS